MPKPKKYTDEYLKKVFLDKVKELGRIPTKREVDHNSIIAKRFGGGSYDQAVNYFGFKPNFSKYNKKELKETLKDKLQKSTCIEIYEMVLRDEIKQFPKYFWKDISYIELRELLKYFFEQKLKWSITDIKNNLDSYIFIKYKLGGGMFQNIFYGSPFKVVDFTYPNQIKEWELKCTPLRYWTKDRCIEATRDILSKEGWTEEDIRSKSIIVLLEKYRISTIYRTFFKGNTYSLINAIYPDKFKPWEVTKVSNNYWTKEKGKQSTKWMIEEKLKWTDEDIKKKYNYNTFKQYKLVAMVNMVFQCSPFKAINATYPGRFKEEDFNNVPINYWTKEKAIKSIKEVLDQLSEEEIKKYISVNFFIENGLRYPFSIFFGNRPFLVLDTIYPKRFNKEDFYTK